MVAVEQVGQAMVELADHQQHAHGLAGVVQFPVHVEGLGDVAETVLYLLDIPGVAIVETEHRAHEKAPAEIVVELRHLPDVATVVREVGGDGSDNAGHRGTGDLDDEMVFFVLHDTSSG
ncbi:hypothetical protein D3C84_940480 [compost metagenome]